jgi:hypothetical protein
MDEMTGREAVGYDVSDGESITDEELAPDVAGGHRDEDGAAARRRVMIRKTAAALALAATASVTACTSGHQQVPRQLPG